VHYRFHFANRLASWEAAYPQFSSRIAEFTAIFLNDPADPRLQREPYVDPVSGPRPNVFHYQIPDVPIPLVIEVENAVRVRSEIDGMIDEPEDAEPDDGERWAKILSPRGPEDVIPDAEML
jgi:hypothetical protein